MKKRLPFLIVLITKHHSVQVTHCGTIVWLFHKVDLVVAFSMEWHVSSFRQPIDFTLSAPDRWMRLAPKGRCNMNRQGNHIAHLWKRTTCLSNNLHSGHFLSVLECILEDVDCRRLIYSIAVCICVCVFMIWVFMSHIDIYTYRSTALLWKHHDLHIKVNMETPIVNSWTWRSNSERFPTWPSHWVVGPSCSSEIGTVWWFLYL